MKRKRTTYILMGMIAFGAIAPSAITGALYATAQKETWDEYFEREYPDWKATETSESVTYESSDGRIVVEIERDDSVDVTGTDCTVYGAGFNCAGYIYKVSGDTVVIIRQ